VVPRASAYEYTANEIARPVVAIGRTRIGIIAVVPVRTDWGRSVLRVSVVSIAVVVVIVIGVAVVSISVVAVVVVVVIVGAVVRVSIVVVPVIEVAIVATHANSDRNLRRRTRRRQEQNP
jgi:hypothetical protein